MTKDRDCTNCVFEYACNWCPELVCDDWRAEARWEVTDCADDQFRIIADSVIYSFVCKPEVGGF